MAPRICAGISLFIFAAAAWIGFVDVKDASRRENRLKDWLNRRIFTKLGCNWAVENPYALTRIGLIIGLALGIASIILA